MKRLLLTVCLVAATLSVTACTGTMAPSTSGGAPGSPVAPGQPVTPGKAEGGSAVSDAKVITTGWMVIRTNSPADAADRAVELVERSGGKIASRTEQSASGRESASARMTLRIPSDDVTKVTDDLRGLGTVVSLTIDQTDVTEQAQDLEARIKALRTSVDRLLALLSSATNTADLIQIEASLSDRQAQLDSLVAQRDSLSDRVDYSTIELQLLSADVVPSAGPGDFWGGLAVGWNSLLSFASGALVVLGIMLPWLGVLVIAAAVVTLIVVLASRRKAKPLG